MIQYYETELITAGTYRLVVDRSGFSSLINTNLVRKKFFSHFIK